MEQLSAYEALLYVKATYQTPLGPGKVSGIYPDSDEWDFQVHGMSDLQLIHLSDVKPHLKTLASMPVRLRNELMAATGLQLDNRGLNYAIKFSPAQVDVAKVHAWCRERDYDVDELINKGIAVDLSTLSDMATVTPTSLYENAEKQMDLYNQLPSLPAEEFRSVLKSGWIAGLERAEKLLSNSAADKSVREVLGRVKTEFESFFQIENLLDRAA